MYEEIYDHLEKYPFFKSCKCDDYSDCEGKDQISCSIDSNHLHLLIDNCIITDNDINKCDCFILYKHEDDSVYVFLIEFKKGGYKLNHVKSQIQTGLDYFSKILDKYRYKIVYKMILYAPSHKRNIDRYKPIFKVKYGKINLPIITLNNGEILTSIIKKNKLLI